MKAAFYTLVSAVTEMVIKAIEDENLTRGALNTLIEAYNTYHETDVVMGDFTENEIREALKENAENIVFEALCYPQAYTNFYTEYITNNVM